MTVFLTVTRVAMTCDTAAGALTGHSASLAEEFICVSIKKGVAGEKRHSHLLSLSILFGFATSGLFLSPQIPV